MDSLKTPDAAAEIPFVRVAGGVPEGMPGTLLAKYAAGGRALRTGERSHFWTHYVGKAKWLRNYFRKYGCLCRGTCGAVAIAVYSAGGRSAPLCSVFWFGVCFVDAVVWEQLCQLGAGGSVLCSRVYQCVGHSILLATGAVGSRRYSSADGSRVALRGALASSPAYAAPGSHRHCSKTTDAQP